MSDIEDEPPPVLLPCSICSRTFRPEVLERHAKVCEKTASKKRKVFDSFKSRVTGTELEEFLGPAPLPGQAPKRVDKSPAKKTRGRPKWKETHENLIAVLRAARGAATGEAPPALAPKNAGNEQCPSCGRFFGPRAFDRHVQFCKEKTSRIKLTPSKVSQAQERLEARTKYKAPLSLKPKLTTKEKYSPMLSRKVESSDTNSISSSTKSHGLNSASKTTKPLPGKTNLSNFSRQSPTRASERQRSISPRKTAISSARAAREVGKGPAQPKIKDNLTATEDLRPRQNTKITTHQDKLRGQNRKNSNFEDDLPNSNKKRNCREKSNVKSYMSSDEGTETDSMYSSSTYYSEKMGKKDISPGSPIKKNLRPGSKEQRSSHNEGSRSSRRSKARMPLINDLSVNDESFGIHVAPCPHRSPRQGNRSADHKKNTPRTERMEEVEKQPEHAGEAAIPAVAQVRSSRIPKPVAKGGDVKKEYEARDEAAEECPKKDRERTATIKKLHDISSMSTDELLNISDELDLISDLDDIQMRSGFETESSEMEEISNSAFLEMVGEEFVKIDDSVESKEEEIPSPVRYEKKEDEFIVLHQAEPEKFLDDDMDMKLSISEPCFKTDYPEASAFFKANPGLFVFNSPPKYSKRKSTHRKKSKTAPAKKVKIIPRFLTIRERTFLADDNPKVKRLKLSGKEKLPPTKITNLNEYFFGHLPALREEHRKLIPHVPNSHSDALAKRKHTKSGEGERQKVGKVETVEKVSAIPEKQKKGKKFEYFEIGKDVEEPGSDGRKGETESGSVVEEREGKNESSVVEQSERRKEKISGSRADISEMQSNNKMRKLTICYSDEEFEELRQKKEKRLNRLNPKSLNSESDDDHSAEDLPLNPSSVMNSSDRDSFPMDPGFGKMNSIAEEEEPSSSARSIEIEDFIIKKPNKSSIMSKSGNCLEELFPKPPEKTEMKQVESRMAIPLSYVVDSLYDLKDEGCVSSRKDNGIRLPEIQPVRAKKDKKGNSMSSLVQIWKARKEMIENGTLYEAQMAHSEKAKRQKQKNPFQIALLPLVLTQKLAEVAGQFDNSKSKDENYDPFKQAERQMMALLSWPSTADLKSSNDNSQSSKNPNRSANLETSPTSAFSKYQSKDEQSPKEVKENVNQKKVSSARSGKRNEEHAPVYSAADDWEEIFEKHFDLNRNEMNDKMTRSVKSALDGLIKKSQKSYLGEIENSPPLPQRNQSELADNSIIEDIAYTSTPKKSSQRLSNASDGSFERSGYRKSSNSSYARVTPPDDFIDGVGREDWGRKSNRNSGVSLSSLSFCSQASDTTLADEEIMRTNLEIIGIGKSTPRTSKRRFARSQSVFDERNKMLFAKTFDNHFSSSDENEILPTIADVEGKKSVQSNPYPKSLPSRFPRSQSVMDGRCRGDGDHYEDRDLVSSPEGSKNRKAKMSGDSAYSSLNRRSPRAGVQSNQQQEDRLSSSGSEHSLPRLSSIEHPLKPVSLNFENTSSVSSNKEQPYKMSKFCHECGSKYPVAVAKFCCECGVRRLII